MSGKTYIIGTRSSALAMWQSQFVQWLLSEQWPDDRFELLPMNTKGDDLSISISSEGGKGLYVKDLQDKLLMKKVDICVHSLKDFPVRPPDGCALAAVIERGEARDVLVSKNKIPLEKFTSSMKIGTSSLRRKASLKAMGSDAEIVEMRGNVDTRIEKVRKGEVDGAILAAAGILRLGLENEITEYFDPKIFIPAPGQGAIAIECRSEDDELRMKLRRIHHDESGQAVEAERAFLGAIGGSCTLPLGAWCEVEQFQMRLHVFLADPNGKQIMMDRGVAPVGHGVQLGETLASRFLHYGARRILEKL